MKIYGLDFTSAPRRAKPITCLHAEFSGDVLDCGPLSNFTDFDEFEALLKTPGPWVAGMDFPFSLPRRFIENMNWPENWQSYVKKVAAMTKPEFRKVLDDYKRDRPAGDKEHQRETDIQFGGVSPQKQYGVPVALMFYEGAPKLMDCLTNIPFLRPNTDNRTIFEAYPGAMARQLIGNTPYKTDTKAKQTPEKAQARNLLFKALIAPDTAARLGFTVKADPKLAKDPSGDHLDALLCAVQAAYAWSLKSDNYGMPLAVDPIEGRIAGLQS